MSGKGPLLSGARPLPSLPLRQPGDPGRAGTPLRPGERRLPDLPARSRLLLRPRAALPPLLAPLLAPRLGLRLRVRDLLRPRDALLLPLRLLTERERERPLPPLPAE